MKNLFVAGLLQTAHSECGIHRLLYGDNVAEQVGINMKGQVEGRRLRLGAAVGVVDTNKGLPTGLYLLKVFVYSSGEMTKPRPGSL